MNFWERVQQCKHTNLYPDYYTYVSCGTPYCSAGEVHCKDCGAFITTCGCGYCNEISGWPYLRQKKLWQKAQPDEKPLT